MWWFSSMIVITISLGINPVRGGSPARDISIMALVMLVWGDIDVCVIKNFTEYIFCCKNNNIIVVVVTT